MTLDQQQTLNNDFPFFGTAAFPKMAQTFKPTVRGAAARFELTLGKVGSPTDALKLEIYSDNAGAPGTLLATADNVILGSSLLVGFANSTVCDFDFTTGQTLNAETTYWAVLSRTGPTDELNYYRVFTSDEPSDPYTRGEMFYFDTAWHSFTADQGGGFFYDFVFNEYYNPSPPAGTLNTVPSYSFRFNDKVTSY